MATSPLERAESVIREVILNGNFGPLQPLPSYDEISKRYRISRASVVKGMMLLEQKGVVSRQHRRGTFVRPTVQRETLLANPVALRCINIISRTGDIPVEHMRQDYLLGFTAALERHDVRMRFLASAREDRDITDRLMLPGVPLQAQGCLFVSDPIPELCHSLISQGVPYVLMLQPSSMVQALPASHSAYVNKYAGGFNATEYLLKLGHRRIGCVGPGVACGVFGGYCAALTRAGMLAPSHSLMEIYAEHASLVLPHAIEILRRADRPTALVTTNDAIALGMLDAALSLGIRVPEELSIIGYNDEPEAANARVPLTVMTNPRRLLARTAAELLLDVAERKHDAPQTRVLESHLVVRKSTAPAPG